jgi:hypothetical protein
MNPSIYRRQVIYVLQDSIRNCWQYGRQILKDVENSPFMYESRDRQEMHPHLYTTGIEKTRPPSPLHLTR